MESIELAHETNPWVVDLHASLDRSYFPGLDAGFGTPGPGALAEWTGPYGTVRVLPQPLLAAYLALSAGADLPSVQLLKVVELIHVLRQDTGNGTLQWPALRDLLRRTHTMRFAWPGFAMAEELCPGTVDPALLRELDKDGTARMRRVTAIALHALPFHLRQCLICFLLALPHRRELQMIFGSTGSKSE